MITITKARRNLLIGLGSLLLLFVVTLPKEIVNVDNSEIVIVQSAFTGKLTIYKTPGPEWRNFGSVTRYKKSNQFWFLSSAFKKSNKMQDTADESLKIRYNDGGHAQISGSIRWTMPLDDQSILKIHTSFGSQEAIESQLIRQAIVKAVYMTGPLMSSKQSSAEKRTDMLSFIEDQTVNGVYQTEQKDVTIKDDLTGNDKQVTIVQIVENDGIPKRQEKSMVSQYNIPMSGLSLNSIDYDNIVEKQIEVQQEATMQIQTAIANSKKAEQDAITAKLQGDAKIATATANQNVEKASRVTKAQADLDVQELATKQASLYKQQQILQGEGEAAKQKLIMQANGALDQKLAAYVKVQQYWAEAFSKYTGNVVPQIQTGGGNGVGGNGAMNFMDLMSFKAAKDLSLDLTNKK